MGLCPLDPLNIFPPYGRNFTNDSSRFFSDPRAVTP